MANITVAALIITNAAVDHMWERHLIASEQVREILDSRYKVIPNHGDAPYRLIGRDNQGRCIAAPIYPTDDPIIWKAVSAWYCDKEEQVILKRRQAAHTGTGCMRHTGEITIMAIMQNDHDTSTYLPPHAPILAKGDVLEGVNVPNPKLILQIDLEREESRLLSAAASAANLSTTRYIKQVALAAARAYQDEQTKQAS